MYRTHMQVKIVHVTYSKRDGEHNQKSTCYQGVLCHSASPEVKYVASLEALVGANPKEQNGWGLRVASNGCGAISDALQMFD